MIFIFGTSTAKGHPIKTNEYCPGCNAHDIYAIPTQSYFHFFWIPIFPTSKRYVMLCNNCGGIFNQIRTTPEIRKQYKTPKWTYAGSIIGLFFIGSIISVAAFTSSKNSTKENTELITYFENPQIGDIYQVKNKQLDGALLKIESITSDSIYFYPHAYNFRDENNEPIIHQDSTDFLVADQFRIGLSKEELKKDLARGKIYVIYR